MLEVRREREVCSVPLPRADMCSGSAGEESVETLSEQLELSEFIIKPGAGNSSSIRPLLIMCVCVSLPLSGTSLQLQGHVHWLLELAIKLVSTLPAANTTSVSHTYMYIHVHV